MGVRFAAGNEELAQTMRDHQDVIAQWRRLDSRLVRAVSEPPAKCDSQTEAKLREELTALDEKISILDERLAQDFPEYAELANQRPLSLSETQNLLGPDEALMTYLVWDDTTFLWVLRHDNVAFQRLDVGRQEIEDAVTVLRTGLDQTDITNLGDVRSFDIDEAVAL